MRRPIDPRSVSGIIFALLLAAPVAAADVVADLKGYSRDCGIDVRQAEHRLVAVWPVHEDQAARLTFDLRPGKPLIESLALVPTATDRASQSNRSERGKLILEHADPITFLTVGTRKAPPGRPPTMPIWNVFFDKPANRPHDTHASKLEREAVRVTSRGRRAIISIQPLSIGSFQGSLDFTLYSGSPLIHVESVVSTEQDERAIIYDTGLVLHQPEGQLAWMTASGEIVRRSVKEQGSSEPIAVRHRTLIAESDGGAIAAFPPPHQFFFPRDWSDNFKFTWAGSGHHGIEKFSFGIRTDPTGGGAFVPWFNAPPQTKQRLGVFYLLTSGKAETALEETLRYTHKDRFVPLPGHITFTSHYHMAIAVAAIEQKARGISPLPTPDFVRVFKDMGVNAIHLGEFHGDGHPRDPGPLRLPELESMFSECKRLSDDELLLIPGEEINDFLGIKEPGKHPGHWMSLFPQPVYWIMQRGKDQPFVEQHERYGKVYRVGSREDMIRLLKAERGLAWTAHPRIKASSWTPDIFRNEDFYLADYWLGAAWKAMPADLSHDRLGIRGLDLLDDMSNWGQKKYLPGEVDVFKIDRTHELYGHMNINYVALDRLPRYDEGWQPILDALRAGQFFVTTGEVLIHDFQLNGKRNGEELPVDAATKGDLRVDLSWTFPLQFAEVISGDGQRVYRQRIELQDTQSFGRHTFHLTPELAGRRWLRFEVWDVATNGAFTQPVWLTSRK